MVGLVNKGSATTPSTASVSSTSDAPAEEPIAPAPAAPHATSDESPPPATEAEPPASTTAAPTTPSTTEHHDGDAMAAVDHRSATQTLSADRPRKAGRSVAHRYS